MRSPSHAMRSPSHAMRSPSRFCAHAPFPAQDSTETTLARTRPFWVTEPRLSRRMPHDAPLRNGPGWRRLWGEGRSFDATRRLALKALELQIARELKANAKAWGAGEGGAGAGVAGAAAAAREGDANGAIDGGAASPRAVVTSPRAARALRAAAAGGPSTQLALQQLTPRAAAPPLRPATARATLAAAPPASDGEPGLSSSPRARQAVPPPPPPLSLSARPHTARPLSAATAARRAAHGRPTSGRSASPRTLAPTLLPVHCRPPNQGQGRPGSALRPAVCGRTPIRPQSAAAAHMDMQAGLAVGVRAGGGRSRVHAAGSSAAAQGQGPALSAATSPRGSARASVRT